MDVTKSSGSCGARRGQHRGCHSEGVSDDFHGHWLVQETARGSRRGGDPRLAVASGTLLSWFSGGKGKARLRNKSAAHCPLLRERSRWPRRAWFSAFSCSSPSLALASFCSLGTTCCSTTFCALWWSVSASAIATVSLTCFVHARSSRNPATPRCAAASAFALHGTTTGVSSRLTVRVDRKPKWLRVVVVVAVCGGWEVRRRAVWRRPRP